MALYSIWPYLGILAAALLVLRLDRPFSVIDGAASKSDRRFAAIDGLRGLLAFSVFGHHAAVMPRYLETGVWSAPPSAFYTLLGEAGVALFFAITGFLFWGKLLHENGTPDWKKLYIGRLFRIAPLYLAAVFVLLLLVLNRTGFELREPAEDILLDTARWMGLGLLGQPDVNAYRNTGRLMAGVVWTLRYEWLFYFALPLMALFTRKRDCLWFPLAGLASCLALYAYGRALPAFYTSLFFCGMTCASLVYCGYGARAGSAAAFVAIVLGMVALFTQFSTAAGPVQALLLGLVFYVISSGNTFLGMLETKAARRLGEISYGVYLTHGLVLTGVFSIEPVRIYALSGHGSYWATIAVCAFLVVVVATLGFVLVERPGIRLGQLVAAALTRNQAVDLAKVNPPRTCSRQ